MNLVYKNVFVKCAEDTFYILNIFIHFGKSEKYCHFFATWVSKDCSEIAVTNKPIVAN